MERIATLLLAVILTLACVACPASAPQYGFSTWISSNGNILYDYDPTEEPEEEATEPTDPPVPPANWKEEFEASLMGHDAMVVCWYSYLGDGIYEAYCEDPDNPDINGTVYVDAYTGSWNWV